MKRTIEIATATDAPAPGDARLHLLPCKIDHDGHAPVSAYLEITGDDAAGYETFYRGRHLKGRRVHLPDGYAGLVLRSRPDAKELTYAAEGAFSHFYYWNHDREPARTDPVHMCVEFLDLAHAIHEPVSAAQVAQARKARLDRKAAAAK